MAARKQLVSLRKILQLSKLSKEAFQAPITISCISYQQRRHKKYYNSRERPQSREWHEKQELEPALYNPLTDESLDYLEDELVKKHMQGQESSPLRKEPWPRNNYTFETSRVGLLGVKIGKQPLWKKDGTKINTILLQILDNHVIRYTPPEEYQQFPGYNPKWKLDKSNFGSQTVGAISCNPWNLNPDYVKKFEAAGVLPKVRLTRFLVTPDAAAAPGTPLNVSHFNVGDYVDCSARTIFHGFQGVIKRWGFSGMPASHGTTKSHRRGGSLSSGRQNGMWKGTKMPGLMGDKWRIAKGLKIVRMNTKYNVLYVTNGIPGPHHCFVRIYDSSLYKHRESRSQNPENIAMPTRYPDDFAEPLPEDIYADEILPMDSESISYGEEES